MRPNFARSSRRWKASRKPVWIHPARTANFPDYQTEELSLYEIWWTFGWPYESSVGAGAHRLFENARRDAESEDHHPSRRRHGSVFRRARRPGLGHARLAHVARGLQAAAQGAEASPARLLQDVLRGYGDVRLEGRARVRAAFLRSRPRALRVGRSLRSRRRPDVHSRDASRASTRSTFPKRTARSFTTRMRARCSAFARRQK